MTGVFRDETLNSVFDEVGYVIVKLLDDDTVRQLRTIVTANADEVHYCMRSSYYSQDTERRCYTHRKIQELCGPRIEALLPGYEFWTSGSMIKEPYAPDYSMGLHQDGSVVDETEHTAVTVWCPLVDVTEANGCLTVVPGSHRWHDHLRPLGDHPKYSPYRNVKPLLKKRFELPLPLAAGEGVLFHPRLIHASRPNQTAERRLAIQGITAPRGARCFVYYRHSETVVEKFELDPNTLMRDLHVWQRWNSDFSLGLIDVHVEPHGEDEVLALASVDLPGQESGEAPQRLSHAS